ncbi:hypothetical protein BGW38_000397 [Lunasporangiospora selenospora]|uniref:ATP-dependent DNA helicase n=1 Tax=Lunasporangiospora selenospora TaxID=979761 RepID=A0A9P6KEV8_9FUNG|nr:hypothetical protein BGW38_000397 [Lunasporangiospora selenospora]
MSGLGDSAELDDFDLGDLDALDLDLAEEEELTKPQAGPSTNVGRNAMNNTTNGWTNPRTGQNSMSRPNNTHNPYRISGNSRLQDNAPQASPRGSGFGNTRLQSTANPAPLDEFDEFGDLDNDDALLDESDLLESPAPTNPTRPYLGASSNGQQSLSSFLQRPPQRQAQPNRASTSIAAQGQRGQIQQPPVPQQQQQPVKYFSIFSGAQQQQQQKTTAGNNNRMPSAGQQPPQRTMSSSNMDNPAPNAFQRMGSFGNNSTVRPGNSLGQPNGQLQAQRSFSFGASGQTPASAPSIVSSGSIISRTDPNNDFTTDIWRSQETSSTAHAQPPTHHSMDHQAILTWQYPINYPKRDYQYNIIRRALFTNTLVSLPTGLGKTFIAAVVMLNYYRWFPQSKIIFMAPTRPLVNQQIEACFNIVGIPQEDTIELTGQQNSESRKEHWKERRVVFCTPQVAQNDIKSGICPADAIVCLVFDEAHRATGRYAYSEVIRMLEGRNRDIRIMALTATPGSDVRTVQQVVQNLKIAKIELRTEDSMDLQRYVFKRVVQEKVVPCGPEISRIRDRFMRLMRPFLDRLSKHGILRTTDPAQLSRFIILQGRDAYIREHPQHSALKSMILKYANVAMGLVHAYDLLVVHGIKSFYANMDPFTKPNSNTTGSRNNSSGSSAGSKPHKGAGSKRKYPGDDDDDSGNDGNGNGNGNGKDDEARRSLALRAMEEVPDFMRMMEELRQRMKHPDFMSHPKLERLIGVVVQHFLDHQDEVDSRNQAMALQRAEAVDNRLNDAEFEGEEDSGTKMQTRVIVFANYRESVEEISRVLDQHRPLIKVQSFIGQATTKGKKGISQKEQQRVVADFQKGEHNVLVATSIGEEGLDIGDVDLIVCYDSHASPIRMLQRMGRTGRKRKGKICLLLSEGQEEQKYRRSVNQYKNVQKAITQGQVQYYPHSVRILPNGPLPECNLVHINVPEYVAVTSKRKKRKIGGGMGENGVGVRGDAGAFLDEAELARFQRRYRLPKRDVRVIKFTEACQKRHSKKRMDKVSIIGHSTRTVNYHRIMNRISDSRVEQSFAGGAEMFSLKGPYDSYGRRMMSLLDEADIARLPNRGTLEKTTDMGPSKPKIPAARKDAGKSLANKGKRAATKLDLSTGPNASKGKAKSIETYLRDTKLSDDEVDMEIMGGLGPGLDRSFSIPDYGRDFDDYDQFDNTVFHDRAESPPLFSEDILDAGWRDDEPVKYKATDVQTKPTGIWAVEEEEEDVPLIPGFDFREVPESPLWHAPDPLLCSKRQLTEHASRGVDTDKSNSERQRTVAVSFTVIELPPVPERRRWYQPKPRTVDSSMDKTSSPMFTKMNQQPQQQTPKKDMTATTEEILFIESSQEDPDLYQGSKPKIMEGETKTTGAGSRLGEKPLSTPRPYSALNESKSWVPNNMSMKTMRPSQSAGYQSQIRGERSKELFGTKSSKEGSNSFEDLKLSQKTLSFFSQRSGQQQQQQQTREYGTIARNEPKQSPSSVRIWGNESDDDNDYGLNISRSSGFGDMDLDEFDDDFDDE